MRSRLLRSSLFNCLLIGLTFLFVANNFWEKKNMFIISDGRAYYEYLPATFIYQDLEFSYLDTLHSSLYPFEESLNFYQKVDGKRINKYFIGTALCETPAFLLSHLYVKSSGKYRADGFSEPYQWAIYLNAFLFFLIGLYCVSELLKSYEIPNYVILPLLAGLAFCTSLPFYVYVDSSYSHVYSFAAVSFFLLSVRKYLLSQNGSWLALLIFGISLVVLIRPVNGLVLLFLPLFFTSRAEFRETIIHIFTHKRKGLIIGILLGLTLLGLQMLVWYVSRGKLLVYAYGKEGFIWSHENFIAFLFSVRKGFFFWSPWFLLLCVSGLAGALALKRYRFTISWLLAFYIIIFVSCSWWFWSYAASYGSRPMVDFYAAFVLLAIPLLQRFKKIALTVLALGLLFAPITITQVYQYQRYIIKQDDMTWQNYKDVFMQRGPLWEGYLLRQQKYDLKQFYSEQGPKRLHINPNEVFCADSARVNSIIFNSTVFAEYSFSSPDILQDDWVNVRICDTNGVLVKQEASQLKGIRRFPTDSTHFQLAVEIPQQCCIRVYLDFHNLQKKALVENIQFKLKQHE
ncbi:MAG: hypothetical protein K0R65_1246 [Crocinitomicaceae bacterium]|jgi:hypothetical protein|nr:hypothetical protein [Crocinitomicaceae bacterium]